jgi:protein TonB
MHAAPAFREQARTMPHALETAGPSYERHVGLAVAIALHIAVLAALLSYAPVRDTIRSNAPIMVSYFLTPEAPAPVKQPDPPRPLPKQVTPRPIAPRTVQPAPVRAIPIDAPAPFQAVVPDTVEPLPPVDAPTAPDAPSPPATPAPPAPLPIFPPSFNAAYLDNPAPAYPALARRSGEQGRVLLRVHVTASGTTDTVEIHTGSGSERLDLAARDTVKRWRFVPARQGDVAVAAWVLVPIIFTLEN